MEKGYTQKDIRKEINRMKNCLSCKKEMPNPKSNQRYCKGTCGKKMRQKHRDDYKNNNRNLVRKKDREYYKKNSKVIGEKQKEYNKKKPLETKVRAITWRKYKDEKTNVCSKCNKKGKTDFHHISYEPNLFVEVCRSCHKKIHVGGRLVG